MAIFDHIIAGGGAAGLALAYQMGLSQLRGQSILVVDRDTKERNDRTWSFWTNKPTQLDHLVYHTWSQLEVVSEDFHCSYDLRPYSYKMIRGIDYYKGMREALSTLPNLTMMTARVSDIAEVKDKTGAQVIINDEPYGAKWAYSSIFKLSDFSSGPARYHYLKQHFKGWEIETPNDCFDPSTVTMFDFRTPQKGSMRFFYILPFSRRHALVEYTIFSHDILKPHEYDRAIAEYLENVLKITRYRTESVETGVIPMTDMPVPRMLSEHVMAIGTKGGLIKPSTGYGFLRMQKDAAAMVESLVTYGDPYHLPVTPARYHLFDSLMLQVMYRQGSLMKHIFTQLFKNNSIQQIFRFLDEEAPLSENIPLLASLPKAPFLKALFRVKLLRRI